MSDQGEFVECFFLIPKRLNNKRKVPRAYFKKLEDTLYSYFQGYRAEGTVRGAYRMADGSRQIDELVKYVVALQRQEIFKLQALLRQCASDLSQESIYFGITGSKIEFVEGQETER